MSAANIKIVFGGGSVLGGPVDQMSAWLDVLEELGIQNIDSAAVYGDSETLLGQAHAASRFTVDTKSLGGLGPECTKDVVIAQCKESLEKLQTDSVSCIHLFRVSKHFADDKRPMCTTCTLQSGEYQSRIPSKV